MVVVGEVIASKIIEKLVEVGFEYAADQFFARGRRMNDELQRLKDALPRIQSVVNAAESGQGETTGDLDKWLWQLKGAVYVASDVLDDLDYTEIQKRAEAGAAGRGPRGSKVSRFVSDSKRRVSKFSKRAFKSDPTLEKLRGAVKRLSEVAAGVEVFNSLVTERNQLQQQQQQQQQQHRETGPIVRERDVLGRDEERKEVLQWLMRVPIANEDHEGISLFSIVGLGGVGKTTLAQLVYRDDTLQSSFSIKIWVCVSTRFDVKKIMGDILQYATNRRPDVGGLARLQEDLEALVSSKKFLHAEEAGFQHLHSIESLEIAYCPNLKMATDAVTLTSLSRLGLSGWNHITSFPSEEACRRLTSLQVLQLEDWGGLMSVEGLKALSHLGRLTIHKCPKLVQATTAAAAASSIKGKEEEEEFTLTVGDLTIDDPLLLHVEPLRKLTSVTGLRIGDCGNLECEGDIDPWLLRNRTSLRSILLEKYSTAESLPRSLQALSSLEHLPVVVDMM